MQAQACVGLANPPSKPTSPRRFLGDLGLWGAPAAKQISGGWLSVLMVKKQGPSVVKWVMGPGGKC